MALGPPAPPELRDVAPGDAWETLRRGARLVSSRVGLVRRVVPMRYQAQDPVAFTSGVLPADFSRCVPGGQLVAAAGVGRDAVAAAAATIAEAAERHCACFYDRDGMVLGSFRELRDHAVSPELLRLFSREQVERAAGRGPAFFDDDTRLRWVWAHSLGDGGPRLVPASLVYLNYRPEADEALVGHGASTGLSAGLTREEALLGGLLEVVERDAFTLAFMHRRAGRRIQPDEPTRRMLNAGLAADRPGVDVKLFDLTTELGVPVVFALARRRAEFGCMTCVGASARLAPRRALEKSVLEASQNFPYMRYLLQSQRAWQPAPDFSNVTTFEQHFLAYLKRPELGQQALAFWDRCEESVALEALPDHSTGRVLGDLERAILCVRGAGYEPLAVDITTPDVAEAGLSVVRVLVPGLVPLHSDHRRPYLGVRRLVEGPPGWAAPGAPPALNPFPHPFP